MTGSLEKDRLSVKDLSNHIFGLMEELVAERNYSEPKTTMTTEPNEPSPDANRKITKYELATLLKELYLCDSLDIEKYKKDRGVIPSVIGKMMIPSLNKPDWSIYESLAEDMIKSISTNKMEEDHEVFMLKDFEFVVDHYLNNQK
jgi:hypothetical protein